MTGLDFGMITITPLFSSGRLYFTYPPERPMYAITTHTTLVVGAETGKEFDGSDAPSRALEYARELAHSSNKTVYLLKVYKTVKPKREVVEEDV